MLKALLRLLRKAVAAAGTISFFAVQNRIVELPMLEPSAMNRGGLWGRFAT